MPMRTITELHSLRTAFDVGAISKKDQLVRHFTAQPPRLPGDIRQLAETMIFLIAYPHSDAFRKNAERCLRSLLNAKRTPPKRAEWLAEGMDGDLISGRFSFPFIEWVVDLAPGRIRFESFGASEEVVQECLAQLLPPAEREYFETSDEPTVVTWTERFGHKKGQLHFLIELFTLSGLPVIARDALFDRLEVSVVIDLSSPLGTAVSVRITTGALFFQKEPNIRSVDVPSLLAEPLHAPLPANESLRAEWITCKRMVLASLGRETDPGTYTDLRDVQLYEVGRGLSILLCGMQPEYRLPLDAYIGFMAFRNGVPCAYGGAWMLGEWARIGVNIFPAFRGGESAYLFAQLMRVYHQCYGVHCIEAEPYQIGKENDDGLASGAFWFYYKLGFRPVHAQLAALAQSEAVRIARNKNYRTPVATLRKLVEGPVVFALRPLTARSTRSASRRVSDAVRRYHGGSRTAAQQWINDTFCAKNGYHWSEGLSPENSPQTRRWLMHLLSCRSADTWTSALKNRVVQTAEAKVVGTDSDYALQLLELLRHPEVAIAD